MRTRDLSLCFADGSVEHLSKGGAFLQDTAGGASYGPVVLRLDVLVDMEEVVGVVPAFDLDKALVVPLVVRAYAVLVVA